MTGAAAARTSHSRRCVRARGGRPVELADVADRERACTALAAVGCGDPEPDQRPNRLMLPAPGDSLELIEGAAAALRTAQIHVSDIGLRRPTLDDVFLKLTGAPASENGGPFPRPAAQPAAAKPRSARIRLELPPPSAWRGDITDAAVVTGRNLRHFIRAGQPGYADGECSAFARADGNAALAGRSAGVDRRRPSRVRAALGAALSPHGLSMRRQVAAAVDPVDVRSRRYGPIG
jgi:hypothetical protein